MGKSDGRPLPVCLLAHEMIKRLTEVIGNCDLVRTKIRVDSESSKRLFAIREIACCMVVELNRHQCELNGQMRTTVMAKDKCVT